MSYKDKEKQRYFDRIWKRKQRVRNRLKVIKLLGSQCIDCGIMDTRVLQIDHIKPILRAQEDRNKFLGSETISKILNQTIDKNSVALRCANCHMIKTNKIDRITYKDFKGY